MAKVLKDTEMAQIIWDAVQDERVIEDEEAYVYFLEELTDLLIRRI